jgi:hypothetical protein
MGRLKRTAGLVVILLAGTAFTGHGLGLSLSYFLPRGGRFSHPVSPLSIRDVGLVGLGRYFEVACSLTLYDITGMAIKDEQGQPIDTPDPVAGPFLSVLGSSVAKIIIPVKNLELVAAGGVFGCYNIDLQLNNGVLDRYLAAESDTYDAVASDITAAGCWGWGFLFGASATYYVKGQLGIRLGANYYLGAAELKLSGTYDGYTGAGGSTTENISGHPLGKAQLDYSGLEFIVGLDVRL